MRTYCHLVEGNLPAAALTLDVMRERGISDDAFFALASGLVDGNPPKAVTLPAPSGLHFALLVRAGITPAPGLTSWLGAAAILSKSDDPLLRLAALERSAAAGIIPAEQLAAAYEGESFTADELDDPDAAAPKLTTSRANALHYQAIVNRTRPAARAAAFAAALDRADAQNRFAMFAQVARTIARQMSAVPETAWLAPYVTRVLLYNGDAKPAATWLTMLTSPTDAATANALQIQAGIAYPSTENLARMAAAMSWLGQNALKPSGSKDWLMARATREIPLLAALGFAIPPDALWAVSGSSTGAVPTGPAAEALASLSRASSQARLGETVLNVLVVLGQGGPSRAQGQTVVRCIEALQRVGLRDEARALASEAVLGIPMRKSR
jgi:hypothetical protein